jgi:Arc/MetJ family transcription regulator
MILFSLTGGIIHTIMCTARCIDMRTNVVIDDRLIKDALKLSKMKTKKELIHRALEEFIRNRKRLDLKEIRGKIRFAEDYNYKEMRSR